MRLLFALLSVLLSASVGPSSAETVCELIPPIVPPGGGDDLPEFGLITIPGADIPGVAYK